MTFKRLIIGRIPQDFNVNEELIFSDLCFNKIEDLFKFKSEIIVPETSENIDLRVRYILDLANNYSLEFAKKYNLNFHDYSTKFWQTIYVPYLYNVLTILYSYEETISNIVHSNKQKLKVKIALNTQMLHLKTEQDLFLNFNVEIQEILVSEIIMLKFSDYFELESNYKIESSKNPTLKNKIGRIADSFFTRVHRGYGINFSYKIILHLFLCFTKSKKGLKAKPSFNNKSSISNIFFIKIIEKFIPENLKSLDSFINRFNFKFFSKNRIRLASNKLHSDTASKVLLALSEEANEIIIPTQHGGHMYGSYSGESLIKKIEYSRRRFITWGWSTIDNKYFDNAISLPSPFLSKFINAHKKKNESIIIVSTYVPKVSTFAEELLASSTQKKNYIKLKVSLISQFESHQDFNKIKYRPCFSKNNHFNDISYLKQFFPFLKVLKNNLHHEILKCKLLILDHPGTTWNIAMVANIPIFLFFNINHWNLSHEAKLFLEDFKKLGIYHENSESLVRQYNLINENEIFEWWNSEEIQSLRFRWISKYAKAERFWILKWMKELKKI